MSCGRLHIKRFHVLMFVIWQFAILFGGFQIIPIFLNYKPEWSCDADGDWGWSRNCSVLDLCPDGNMSFRTPFVSAVQEFRMLCGPLAYFASIMSSLVFGGVLIGAILFGQLSDFFGRKYVIVLAWSLGVLSGLGTGLAPTWQVLTVFRLLLGVAIGGIINVQFAYTVEMILPEQRLFLRGFFNWGFGRCIVTLVCFLVLEWRISVVILSLLPVPAIICILVLVPESLKWLESKGRVGQQQKALKWIARFNGEAFKPPDSSETVSKSRLATSRAYTIKDLFLTKEMTQTTLTLWTMWFSASLSSYAMDLSSGRLAGDLFVNQFLFGALIGFSKPLIFFLDTWLPQFRRRMLHQGSQFIVVALFVAIVVLVLLSAGQGQDTPMGKAVTIISLVGCVMIEYTWDACYVCGAECFPTVVRTLGIGSSSVFARIGGILAPQMAYLGTLWFPAPFVAVFIVGLISLTVSFKFLPETKGTELVGGIPGDPLLGTETPPNLFDADLEKFLNEGPRPSLR